MAEEHHNSPGQSSTPKRSRTWIQKIDPAVLLAAPQGVTLRSIIPHGSSQWAETARIDAVDDQDEGEIQYFLKVAEGELGAKMIKGEYASMCALYPHVQHGKAPRPFAWGRYDRDEPEVFFLLSEFVSMVDGGLPGVGEVAALVARLHREGASPDGRFGFGVGTCHGSTVVEHGWHDTWEGYFTETTRVLLGMEQEAQGGDSEIMELAGRWFDRVVPRLLRPMETEGREVRPVMLHGDLWHGNVGIDRIMGEVVVFDAAGFYGHNEYELGVWRQEWNDFSQSGYVEGYLEHIPPSWPEEDFDDRNLLYATRVNILDSILYKEDRSYRQAFIRDMRTLVEKFPGGFEEWKARHDEGKKE
ncbi:Fructosamine kinase-domain-containing protein [Cercophora samala]|uniref:protein-ribulosamine 3-kinase n=1 Tax=Cercophora samala TaxID=330535 RepID=A0AA39YZ48_9PEZI|nr:Fructosamine kinase-domain-containing protein [Cercophora samala]